MKKLIIASILTMMVVLSACGTIDPLTILKANSQVSEFLEQYPDADLTMTRLSAAMIAGENDIVNDFCGITLEEKPHYKITLMDVKSNLDIFAYIDAEINEIVCLKKIGKTEADIIEEKYETKPKKEDPETNKGCESEVVLKAEESDGKIKLEWTPYQCSTFKGYKVVWSESVENPKYPENGYLKYITNKYDTDMAHKAKAETNYYAITVLTTEGKVYSNTVKIAAEVEDESDDSSDNDSSDDDHDELELEYELEDGNLKLKWDEYEGNDLTYYKVVWSQENDDLMYPGDSYIQVISDSETTRYEVPSKKFKDGINYYRISAILDGFYKDSDKRINSNVVEIEK